MALLVSVTLLGEERPVARKPHGCNACGGIIGVGDQYIRQRLVDDGPYVWKAHLLCGDLAYWVAHREAGCFYDEESPDMDEVQAVVARFFAALSVGFGLSAEDRAWRCEVVRLMGKASDAHIDPDESPR